MKQLGLALHNYHDAHSIFPPGQIAFAFDSDSIGRFASAVEPKYTPPVLMSPPAPSASYFHPPGGFVFPGRAYHGTSLILQILPALDQGPLYNAWDFNRNVRAMGDAGDVLPDSTVIYPPKSELAVMYCPTRRSSMGAGGMFQNTERVDASWTSGRNDYAGVTGSGFSFNDPKRQTYWLTSAQLQATVDSTTNLSSLSQHTSKIGMFGVNSSTRIASVTDGTSNVVMTAERRVFLNGNPTGAESNVNLSRVLSSDGWCFGGPATLLSTRNAPHTGLHFDEADSVHNGVVQVCMADGSGKRISVNIALRTWQNLGNMAQGAPLDVSLE